MTKKLQAVIILVLLGIFLGACAGEDYTPVYFPPPADEETGKTSPSESVGERRCTLEFTSKLCVMIKGDNIEAGITEGEELCSEVDPFPIHIEGANAVIKGSEFPDIDFEGGGLPVPLKINGKGDGDGSSNIGEGPSDAAGNMSIDGFSLYAIAIGVVGEISGLTFTTGVTEELPHLQAIEGSPPDASGAMTMVIGTVLGSIIPAADEYLLGASLQATFTGSISPNISECGGGSVDKSIEVSKIIIDENGAQTESPIPGDERMEISRGTYIAETDLDVGDRFEAKEKFKVTNSGSAAISIEIPPRIGPFHMSSLGSLTRTFKTGESLILGVSFKPRMSDAVIGEVIEPLRIGPDQFLLVGTALEKSGNGEVSIIDDNGTITKPDVDDVNIGSSELPANTNKSFFKCEEIICNDRKGFTNCIECTDPSAEPCELLPISSEGKPLGELDASCSLVNPDATPMYTIDLKGSMGISLDAKKQVLVIRNTGANELRVKRIRLDEVRNSRSTGQFAIPPNAIFVSKSFASIQDDVASALLGKNAQGTNLPIVLPPYQKGYDETSLFVVVTYTPDDLIGSDGQSAGIGSEVVDKASLKIFTDDGEIETTVMGTTTIQESPALEMYFKTTVGTKYVDDGKDFPLKGITPVTEDLGVPFFMRASDTASSPLRVLSVNISGDDASMFQWLDTKDKIDAVSPDSGKGMRCSVPTVDENTGDMIDESFDLNPVSLSPNGFDLSPGAYTLDSMPLFGCINFHRDPNSPFAKRIYEADLKVTSQELDTSGNPARNPDGSYRQTTMTAMLQAAISPRAGKMVLRVTQTMSGILNPKFPSLSAITPRADRYFATGEENFEDADFEVFLGSIILDPFDETTIKTADGSKVISMPNDGITSVFRQLDTHPISHDFEDIFLYDYANLLHDPSRPEGQKGIFEDYPNVPDDAYSNGWRVFTGSLSYPGPLVPPGVHSPDTPKECLVVNPCSAEGLKKFTKAGVPNGEKGACAFFYASGGRYDSPAFHTSEEMPGGEYENLCKKIDETQTLYDLDTGHYTVDGNITFEEVGFRFFGPTYFHNPGGPLGDYPPLDEVFHMGFTTGILKPQESPDDYNVLPDEKINLAKNEFKINLNDPKMSIPPLCKNNTKNKILRGKEFSSWRYMGGLIFKDKDATIPAGCPEEDNDFTGGSAYLRGRNVDHETGNMTLVSSAKFGSDESLSFAFKDVMIFIILNGWLCDPLGSEDDFEGSECYSMRFNDRDAASQTALSQ